MGTSVSQAQGKMVRPTANMEIAEDHLDEIQLIRKSQSFTSGPTTLDPKLREGLQETPVQQIPNMSSSKSNNHRAVPCNRVFISKQGGRTWQPFVGGKNGDENFRQARIYKFRDKCVVFARNRKFAKLTQ